MSSFNCARCGSEFSAVNRKRKRQKYCSYRCYWGSMEGRPVLEFTDEIRSKISMKLRGKQNALGRTVSEETRKKISIATKGKNRGHIPWNKGKKWGERTGPNHHNWKGGITPLNKKGRQTVAYKAWRKAVFERDNYTCQICGVNGVHLHADHIKPFALFPELRCDVDNGRTLCVPCHKQTPTFAGGTR